MDKQRAVMAERHYKVEVQEDHLERLASARPIQAIAELIWNAVDADASTVRVEIDTTEFGMQSITVRDNGHGIPYAEVPNLFGRLGGSWKVHGNRSKTKFRMLHGRRARAGSRPWRSAAWRIGWSSMTTTAGVFDTRYR
jgi:signal transduction histidine kinase